MHALTLLFLVALAAHAAVQLWLARRQMDPAAPLKFAFGLLLMGLGFLFMVTAANTGDEGGRAAALAKNKKAELVTADTEFKPLEKEIKINWLK